MRALVSSVLIVLTGSIVAAQQPAADDMKRQAEERMKEMQVYAFKTSRVPLEQLVKNAPYSAEVLIESSQTLADGNHINQRSTGRVYRDSEGRVRREEDRSNGTVAISIVDPVAGVSVLARSRQPHRVEDADGRQRSHHEEGRDDPERGGSAPADRIHGTRQAQRRSRSNET